MTVLIIDRCGPGTSIQDGGRFGQQRFGLGPSGAMDRDGLAIANMLVGNPADLAAIEFLMIGGTLRCEGGPARLALAGAVMPVSIGSRKIPPHESVTLVPGETLAIGAALPGTFGYLAVCGGFAIPQSLGSHSLHVRAGIGGLDGRLLRDGDRLPLACDTPCGADLRLAQAPAPNTDPIRVLLGPQADCFSAEGLETFLGSEYTISNQADRMGYRLSGPTIAHARGYNIVSDGIATGAIQVPGTGEPIVLMADRQTTGGYPKIATIISADLPRFAQKRPGERIRFAAVTHEEAVAAARRRAERLAALRRSLQACGEPSLDSERLLSLNLVDGVVAGDP
jgi:biotin-dependent carboxylase-like uncharacterized protein